MDSIIEFNFRNKNYSCIFYVDVSADPCFVFVILSDKELINEFGEDVTIKTDCINLLPRNDDYHELKELRKSLFSVIKTTPEFIALKEKKMSHTIVEESHKKVKTNFSIGFALTF